MYEIEQTLIYFPFSDGKLAYNCVECGAKCCKGFGFHATSSELVQLRKHYPGIEVFARDRGGNVPWLEHRDVLDMVAPTLVTFSLLTLRSRRLARREPTLEATRSLIDQMFWPALLMGYLDMIPWLDFAEDKGDTVKVPRLSELADRFVDAINPNRDDRTLAQMLDRVGADDVPKALHVLEGLGRYARWLRFSE